MTRPSGSTRTPLVVLNVVGLTPALLAHTPRIAAVGEDGFRATLGTVLPAVTCPAQATFLTGALPREHGIVGNGWYFRDLGEVLLWRQHHRLVGGQTVWAAAREKAPGYRVANLCWWFAMGAGTDLTVTPRPMYHADGRKSPDCYTTPPELHDRLEAEFGPFPLFSYWGPGAGITSSAWIAGAARHIMEADVPDLTLVYLPHLDYDLQRHGPDAPEAAEAARAVDGAAGLVIDTARDRGATVVVVSEYGITRAARPIDVNRALRNAGLLGVYTQAGMEYLDTWTSRAFAVADHQVAHVYCREAADVGRVREVLTQLPGVDEVLDDEGKRTRGLDHERAGELVAIAEPGAWFTYYYWLDDTCAPDFARTVDIHRKPGYDPAELLLDPADRLVKARIALSLARRRLGMRAVMDVVPLDPSPVAGTHGRLPASPAEGPVLLCSDRALARDHVQATEVKGLLLEAASLA